MARIVTFADLQTFFEGIIDDSLDQDVIVELANNAKDEIEGERDWVILKNVDESQSSSSSDAYNTNPKTLPTGYLHTCENGNALYVGDDRMPYFLIPFEHRERFKNTARRWYLDLANSQYYISGTGVSGTHHHFYIKRSTDIDSSSQTLWSFPSRFTPLLAFKMAELFYAIDRGEKGRAWDDRWALQRTILHDALVRWDWRLQGKAWRNSGAGLSIDSLPDAIDTNKR